MFSKASENSTGLTRFLTKCSGDKTFGDITMSPVTGETYKAPFQVDLGGRIALRLSV
jgi:hypothetical protein